jgi:hypothetical protein
MQSGESSVSASEQPPHRWENFVGTAIALLTLLLPLWVIGYYSQAQIEIFPETTYQIQSVSK